MNKSFFILVLSILTILNGCLGTSNTKKEEPPPRREFESVELTDISSTEPFVVNEFIKDGISYKKGSMFFSTALLLSEMGILDTLGKRQFEKYAAVFFSELPKGEQYKEVVIPNLSQSSETDTEKNGYFFITKQKTKEDKDCYLIESNIPIASIYGGPGSYNGYVMSLKTSFYKNIIPASWTSIMYIYINGNNLLYGGMAYPNKASPFAVRETSNVGTDSMRALQSGSLTVGEMKNNLKETAEKELKAAKANNEPQDSIDFFEKYSNLSLSAYSYIDTNFDEARRYYRLSEAVKTDIPNNPMGRSFTELRKIMNYLINTVGL